MKYIKKFEKSSENNIEKYEIGDYVLFKKNIISDWKSAARYTVFKHAKIIGINTKGRNFILEVISDGTPDIFYVPPRFFERKLTIKEIEEFDLKYQALKYNL
jgi:hypothetical protein